MIVFYFLISILIAILLLLCSSIILEIQEFEVGDSNKLKNIIIMIDEKKYIQVLDYIGININVKISICSLIEIKISKLNEEKIKKIINKFIFKQKQFKKKYANLYKKTISEKKGKILKNINRFNEKIKLESFDLCVETSLANVEATAIFAGLLNVITSILFLYSYSISCTSIKIKEKNIKYSYKPIYSDEFEINLKSKLRIEVPISIIAL